MPAAERRGAILEAAARLFARGGSAGMTTAALARAAGVSEPILYRHFKSKERLLDALIAETLRRIMAGLEEAAGRSGGPLAALERLCEAYPRLARRLDVESRVIARALAERPSGPVREALRRHYEAYVDLLAGLVRRAQREGTLRRGVSPRTAAWHFIHAAVGFQLTLDLGARGRTARGFEGGLARLLLDGARA